MSERKPPGGESLYRGPSKAPRDKRERERDRAARPAARASADRPRGPPRERAPRRPPRERPPLRPIAANAPRDPARADAAPCEQRVYGLNACLALFAKRPEALRKVWLLESRIPAAQGRAGATA